jgi:ABC-type uncharacterized transport system ATPase subunit
MNVTMSGVTQRFGALTALDSVDFEVKAGTIHALVGENGAGKTTLMRVLYGALHPDEGSIDIDGQARRWRNSAEAIAHGIGMVSQHYSIIPELRCIQNLVLGAEGSFVLDQSALQERATALAKKLGFAFEWDAMASTLSPSAAQKLEIVKLLWRESRVMILDEPTAMLSPLDSDALYQNLRLLADEGATVIVVTHRIPEVLQHCDNVTVLRGGRNVADLQVKATNAEELATLIVGHAVAPTTATQGAKGEPLLVVRDITVKGARKNDAVRGATFGINRGEVVGLAGVDGNGQRELFHAIVGTLPFVGSILLDAHELRDKSASKRIELGLRLIPEDRHEEGVIEDWSLVDNAALGLQRLSPLKKGLWNDLDQRHQVAERVADRFKTKHPGLHKSIGSLSGGNQQRFVAARALELDPRLLLAFQPTRGLDIDGAAQVFAAIREECRKGAAALIVSFDLDELVEHCDRVLVINAGVVTEPDTKERLAIGRLMVGAE